MILTSDPQARGVVLNVEQGEEAVNDHVAVLDRLSPDMVERRRACCEGAGG